jgi:hypothetical protein
MKLTVIRFVQFSYASETGEILMDNACNMPGGDAKFMYILYKKIL